MVVPLDHVIDQNAFIKRFEIAVAALAVEDFCPRVVLLLGVMNQIVDVCEVDLAGATQEEIAPAHLVVEMLFRDLAVVQSMLDVNIDVQRRGKLRHASYLVRVKLIKRVIFGTKQCCLNLSLTPGRPELSCFLIPSATLRSYVVIRS